MNDNVAEILESKWFIPTVVGIAASAGGFLVGLRVGYSTRLKDEKEYKTIVRETVVEEQLDFEFDAQVDDLQRISDPEFRAEVAASRDRVMERDREDPNPRNDPADITVDHEFERILAEEKEIQARVTAPLDEVVFDTEFDHWDYNDEIPKRSKNKPHIIHRDEFWGEELGYSQSTLTYYAGDDILTDQEDTPIYGYKIVTGELQFGHGSNDPGVVFVRNDKQSAEYEVIRHEGSYSQTILGVAAEEDSEKNDLKHSVRKFRPRDD